jgi:hypothetical protein
MQHAGKPGQDHAAAEEAGRAHMLDIGLADGSGMSGEQRHGKALLTKTFSWAGYSADSSEKILPFFASFANFVE